MMALTLGQRANDVLLLRPQPPGQAVPEAHSGGHASESRVGAPLGCDRTNDVQRQPNHENVIRGDLVCMCHPNIGKLVLEKVTKELLQPAPCCAWPHRQIESRPAERSTIPCFVDAMGSIRFATFAHELPCVKQFGLPVATTRPLALARALGSGEGVHLRCVSLTSPYLITVCTRSSVTAVGLTQDSVVA